MRDQHPWGNTPTVVRTEGQKRERRCRQRKIQGKEEKYFKLRETKAGTRGSWKRTQTSNWSWGGGKVRPRPQVLRADDIQTRGRRELGEPKGPRRP